MPLSYPAFDTYYLFVFLFRRFKAGVGCLERSIGFRKLGRVF